MKIIINNSCMVPIYEQIVDRFQMLIIKGVLGPDAQMPSVRSLAAELSINPNTIQKAYSILEQQGFIYPVKGRGAFVSGDRALKEKKTEVFFGKLRELVKEAKEIGISKDLCLQKTAQFYEEVET